MRIVSLLPSATDIVVALGATSDLVGVSHSCGRTDLPTLTSTWVDTDAPSAAIDAQVRTAKQPLYALDVELLDALRPDVVVSQSLCDVCAVAIGEVEAAVRGIASRPTLVDLSPFRLADIPQGFADVAHAIGRLAEANRLDERWQATLAGYRGRFAGRPLRVAFLDWLDPPFAAGHWIPDMIDLLGCSSALASPGQPSYEVTWETIRNAKPDRVVAACCGYTADRAVGDELPKGVDVRILDGAELFSRPSPRLLPSFELLANALEH